MPKKSSPEEEIKPQTGGKPALVRHSIFVLAILGVIFVALLYSVVSRRVSEATFTDGTFGKFTYQALSRIPFLNINKAATNSTATLSIEGEDLKVGFNFSSEDSGVVAKLSKRLGVGGEWSSGMAVTLDEDSILKVKQAVPLLKEGRKLTMDIIFSDNSIEFTTQKGQEVVEVLLNSQNLSASRSGQVTVNELDSGGVEVEIDNPSELLSQAASSGSLTLSEKVQGNLWQLAPKFTRIELQVSEKDFQGKIYIK